MTHFIVFHLCSLNHISCQIISVLHSLVLLISFHPGHFLYSSLHSLFSLPLFSFAFLYFSKLSDSILLNIFRSTSLPFSPLFTSRHIPLPFSSINFYFLLSSAIFLHISSSLLSLLFYLINLFSFLFSAHLLSYFILLLTNPLLFSFLQLTYLLFSPLLTSLSSLTLSSSVFHFFPFLYSPLFIFPTPLNF